MYFAYTLLLAAALLVSLPYWLLQAALHGKYRKGLGERLGMVPERLGGEKPSIWVHAVSVGETLAVVGLVEKLRRRFPQFHVVISTTTDTGQALARSRFGEGNVFYFPLDFAFCIRPYLRKLRPVLVVIAETEFWPNFLRLSGESGARIAVINARISDRSWPGYRRWRGLLRGVLGQVDCFLAQSVEDQRRLADIGAPADRVHVSGNLKFDTRQPEPTAIVQSLRAAFQQGEAGPVLVCGSTVEGEEELLLGAFETLRTSEPGAVMILAPRHPQRFDAVAELLERKKLPFWRRSQWNGEALSSGVLLLDSVGELASLYVMADIAFVGGSLVPRGGHNILEPAQFGVPIVVGPHTENFRDIVGLFEKRGAVRVVDPQGLASALLDLASDKERRTRLGRLGAEVFREQAGATARTLQALETLLSPSAEHAAVQTRTP